MKKGRIIGIFGIISLLWIVTTVAGSASPVLKTIQIGGLEREYKVYIPQNPLYERADGILVCLHGFGRDMDDFFSQLDITGIADYLNMAVAVPQALPEQDPVVKTTVDYLNALADVNISLNSVWGCGLSVVVSLTQFIPLINEELNKDLDDVAFINKMIDEIIDEYHLSDDNIFMLGTSMGAYMTYQYALKKGERLSGIIAIAGSFGLSIQGMEQAVELPVCDFHSITDEVVPYAGSHTMSGFHVALAQPKEDVIDFWRKTNETGEPVTEQVEYYPSTNDITAEKITYPHPDHEVIHYKTNGSPHSYFFKKENGDCMDHAEEIIKFIASHHSAISHNAPIVQEQKAIFYPNPVHDRVYLNVTEGTLSIYDLSGRILSTKSFTTGQADLSFLKPGLYIMHVQSGGALQVSKLIKK